jgi:hypothetical protein
MGRMGHPSRDPCVTGGIPAVPLTLLLTHAVLSRLSRREQRAEGCMGPAVPGLRTARTAHVGEAHVTRTWGQPAHGYAHPGPDQPGARPRPGPAGATHSVPAVVLS